jgi:hypothetical protein
MIRFLKGIITVALANRIYILLAAVALLIAGYIGFADTAEVRKK